MISEAITTNYNTFIIDHINKTFSDAKQNKNVLKLRNDFYNNVNKNVLPKQNKHWKILELNFSNTLSYGENNKIDFSMYENNKIIGIIAPSGYGKTAIVDVILFCIFEKSNRCTPKNIFNSAKHNMKCSLLFSIGSKKYLIERIGERDKQKLSVTYSVNFRCISDDTILNGNTTAETNQNIINLIGQGSYEDYLASCVWIDETHTRFLDMEPPKKKEYLSGILKLNIFDDYCVYIKNILTKAKKDLTWFERDKKENNTNKICIIYLFFKK